MAGVEAGFPRNQIGNVVTMLASLCLQQEDALNRIRLETSHTLHLAQQGQGAVLKALYNAGSAWQVKKNSGEPVQALRVVLFGLLLAETQARIQLYDAAVKAAQTNHVLDKDKRFVYQKWDAQASKLVTDPDKKGLTLEEVHPDGATQAEQRPDHHQVQRKSAPQEGTGQRRKGGIHCGSGNALATRQPHSGPPRSDDRQRGVGSGSRAVETTQSQTRRGLAIALQKALEAD